MGCFDMFHAGHVALLAAAKARCDRLVVGLADDATVHVVKGAERPVIGVDAREQVLTSIRYVDEVVRFNVGTQLQVVLEVCPQCCFAGPGGNPRLQKILETLELGGLCVQELDTAVVHTTDILEGIRKGYRLVVR